MKDIDLVFLDIDIHTFIKELPVFKTTSDDTCRKYNLDINLARAFIDIDKVGILYSLDNQAVVRSYIYRKDLRYINPVLFLETEN